MEALFKIIRSKVNLSQELATAIKENFVCQEYPKKTQLLREHQYCQKLFFLEKGTIRTFYYHNGKDISSWFYNEEHFVSSWYSFYNQAPSFEYIETLDDCTIYFIDYHNYQKLLEKYPSFERFGRLMLEEQVAFIDFYSKGYMFLSAKERYKLLLEYFPDVELRIKLGDIATYLGITQETLSRIRASKK